MECIGTVGTTVPILALALMLSLHERDGIESTVLQIVTKCILNGYAWIYYVEFQTVILLRFAPFR